MAYKTPIPGDVIGKYNAGEWERLGYNDSVVHTDMMSTANRTVTTYPQKTAQKK